MICNKCKSDIPNDSEFCQYCGTAIEKENRYDAPIVDVLNYSNVERTAGFSSYNPKIKSKKKTIIITIVAILSTALIFVIVALFAIPEMKYQYVIRHKNNNDKTTFTYLKELKKHDYKNSAEIYEDLYEWRVTVIAVNSSEEDETTNKTSISRSSPIYFHIKLTGGEPNGSMRITVKPHYPDGETDEYTFNDKWTDGETGWFGWYEGLYEYPEYGATGTLQCKFYDGYGNLIGIGSIRIRE